MDVILARTLPSAGVGLAIGDRLFRAAEGNVIYADDPESVQAAIALTRGGGDRQAR